MTACPPTLEIEHALFARGHRIVAACDEVGRGALAGPVSVGCVAIDVTATALPGVADSKLLTARARTRLLPAVEAWARARAVGHASPGEIDRLGIVGALHLAGLRALAEVTVALGADAAPDVVLLDGNQDWLTAPVGPAPVPPVVTRVKADRDCLSVAAASVLAKVTRDAMMTELDTRFPGYGWSENKGYGTAAHRAAIAARGPSPQHRLSWHLTGAPAGSAAQQQDRRRSLP